MGTYAITGSASGMGRETAQRLRDGGHTVIGVDIKDADVIADLSTPAGRAAAARVLSQAGDRLDGAVLAAGLGPSPAPDRVRQIAAVNYFGVVELLQAWRPALAATGNAKVVVVASNSSTTMPTVPRRTVNALLAHDADKALRSVRLFGPAAPTMMYGASKTRGQPLGAPPCRAGRVGGLGGAVEHPVAPAGPGGPVVPRPGRRFRRPRPAGRVDVFHAVGCRRLPLRQRGIRRRRHRRVLPR